MENLNFKKIKDFYEKRKKLINYSLVLFSILIGFLIRTANLNLLNWKVLVGLDPYIFYQYAEYILKGGLPEVDTFRYYPLGFPIQKELLMTSFLIAFLYKLLFFFNPNVTLMHAAILYPPIFFIFSAIVLYLIYRKIVSSPWSELGILVFSVFPAMIFRTTAGFADKEAGATFFILAAILLFLNALYSENPKKKYIYYTSSAIFITLSAFSWGGYIYAILSIVPFFLFKYLKNTLSRIDKYGYILWNTIWFLTIPFVSLRYSFLYMIKTPILLAAHAASVLLIIDLFLKEKIFSFKVFSNISEFIEKKFGLQKEQAQNVSLIILLGILGLIFVSFTVPQFLTYLYSKLIHPLGGDRFSTSVAENQPPTLDSWISFLTLYGLLLMFIGFSYSIKEFTKGKYQKIGMGLAILYLLLLLFKPQSLLYTGTTLLLMLFSVYAFLKAENYNEKYIFVFLMFLIYSIGAKGAMRLLYVLGWIAPLILVFGIKQIYELSEKVLKGDAAKLIPLFLVLILVLGIPIFEISNDIALKKSQGFVILKKYNQLELGCVYSYKDGKPVMEYSYLGTPSFYLGFKGSNFFFRSICQSSNTRGTSQSWVKAAEWIKENTEKDAVFAHWWDYGYWVRVLGQRATILDGGNYYVFWDHLIGRHVLTTEDPIDALEFLYAHTKGKPTYLLIDPTDIGKSYQFSKIGSDTGYDRLAMVGQVRLDPRSIMIDQKNNITIATYYVMERLDEDLYIGNTIIPRCIPDIPERDSPQQGECGLVYTIIIKQKGDSINESVVDIYYNGRVYRFPLRKVYVGDLMNKVLIYENEKGWGVLYLLPDLQQGFFFSNKVSKQLWVRLYIFNEEIPYFKLVYNSGIKIWKVNFPENFTISEGKECLYISRSEYEVKKCIEKYNLDIKYQTLYDI